VKAKAKPKTGTRPKAKAKPRKPARRSPSAPPATLPFRPPDPASALVAGAIGAGVIGLLGVDAGLLWLVAGVWTIRAVAGSPLGLAWGTACLGVGLRWGTTSLGDLSVATRLNGPTLLTGNVLVQGGLALVFAAAVIGEARVGGLHSPARGERAASAIAVVALVAIFVVRGPGDPGSLLPIWWGAAAAAGAALVFLLRPVSQRLPVGPPAPPAAAGVVVAVVAS
jgi:hypothetical protein